MRNATAWASLFEKSTVIDGVEIAVAMLNLGGDYHPYPVGRHASWSDRRNQ